MATISRATESEPQSLRLLSFSSLPTEIIQQILLELPHEAFLAVSQTSKQLRANTDAPILWRHFCETHYKYWDPRHEFQASLKRSVDDVNWKRWYTGRRMLDRQVDVLIDELIQNARGRIENMERIVNIDTLTLRGNRDLWDVKDALLRHANCADDLPDVLARRFWANATLQRLQRARAVNIWAAVKDGEEVPLEKALAAYDMFVEGLEDAESSDVTELIEDIVKGFKAEHTTYEEWSTRKRAITLALFLRSLNFKGTQAVFYHNLPNNFIVRALKDPEHPALPIICVTIYCAVAKRLGINASPCGFPMHVYAVIESSNGLSLDLGQWPESAEPQRMYIDAFRPDVEVPLSHLTAQLSSMGAGTGSLSQQYLGPASDIEITLRTSRNIMHSVRMAQNRPSRDGIFTDTDGWPDMDVSLYAALWTSVLMQGREGFQHEQRRQMRHHLPFLCELFQTSFPWDVALFESAILPMLVGLPEFGNMTQILRVVRMSDEMRKPVVKRGEHTEGCVNYKIGRVFRHRRFNYQGIIIGWDVKCDASEEWMRQMQIDQLEKGRNQSFYHILADDKSNRYVAQDNIVPTDDAPNEALMKLAGRFFLRYDERARVFVSNMKEEYPDD